MDVKFGKYEILGELGKGATGKVYVAKQTSLNRKVALKILLKKYTLDLDYIADFHREAENAALLSHPNIVTIFDNGSENDEHFIAMELIQGSDLKDVIKSKGKLTLNMFFDYAIQATEAIKYAHEKGIVHRDIKPQNIFLTNDHVVKIGDFGISRRMDENELSQRKKVQGTAKYMAPEQIKGKQPVDGKADIYSLGCVFYEMLTGNAPFSGSSNHEIVYKQLNEKLEKGWFQKSSIPVKLAELINKCLEKKPQNRFQNSEQLLLALKRLKDELQENVLIIPEISTSETKSTGHPKPKKKSRKKLVARRNIKQLAILVFILLITTLLCSVANNMNSKKSSDHKINRVYLK